MASPRRYACDNFQGYRHRRWFIHPECMRDCRELEAQQKQRILKKLVEITIVFTI